MASMQGQYVSHYGMPGSGSVNPASSIAPSNALNGGSGGSISSINAQGQQVIAPLAASNIMPATDVTIPPKPTPIDYSGLIAGANLTQTNPYTGVVGTAKGITVTPTPDTQAGLADQANKTGMDRFKELLGIIPQRENVQESIMQSQQYAQVEQARQQVQNYTNQLNGIQTKLQADQIAQTGQGRGIPEAIIGGQQAQLSREAAIQSLPIQALLASSQGMMDIAQRHLDDLYKLRTEEVNNKYDYQKQVFSAISNYIDKSDERTYQAASKDLEVKRASALKLEEKRAEIMANIASRGGSTAYTSAVQNATDMISLVKAGGRYNTTATEAASIDNTYSLIKERNAKTAAEYPNPKAAYNGDFAATIDTVANMEGTVSGKNAVRTQLKNLVANKDYASTYNQIANTVENTLVGSAKQRFSDARTDFQVMTGLKRAVDAYAQQGGDMGLLKGTEEQIKRKLGIDSGKASETATILWREFQTYRNTMTGAAFGVNESRDYASVNPSLGKSLDLNTSVINGALNQLQNRVVSTVEARVPSSKYIFDYATNPELKPGTTNQPAKDPNDPLGIFN